MAWKSFNYSKTCLISGLSVFIGYRGNSIWRSSKNISAAQKMREIFDCVRWAPLMDMQITCSNMGHVMPIIILLSSDNISVHGNVPNSHIKSIEAHCGRWKYGPKCGCFSLKNTTFHKWTECTTNGYLIQVFKKRCSKQVIFIAETIQPAAAIREMA